MSDTPRDEGHREVDARLVRIEARLAALERALGLQGTPAGPVTRVPDAPTAEASVISAVHEATASPGDTAYGVLVEPVPGSASAGSAVPAVNAHAAGVPSVGAAGSPGAREGAPAPAQPEASDSERRAAAARLLRGGAGGEASYEASAEAFSGAVEASSARGTVEAMIGGRWFAWLGALAVVVAIVLFLKLAWDAGYLRVPPAGRCLGAAGFGVLLMLAGEWARRRVSAWASAGLSAAGVAAVYAAVYAAFGLFDLIDAPAAFALLAATSGLGVGIAARANLSSVAMISIVGAYATPFILGSQSASPVVFPSYLFAILTTGLVLAAWRRGSFARVGWLTWWGTMILGGLWAWREGAAEPLLVMTFLGLCWSVVHASAVVATRGERGADTDAFAEPADFTRAVPPSQTGMLLSSFGVTAWSAGLAVWAARESGVIGQWLPPLAGAGVAMVLAQVLCGMLRVLVDVPRTGRERLGAALLVQAGALVVAGVALSVAGRPAVPVWLVMGLAAVVGGRWIRSRGLDVYGVVVMGIGAGRLIAWDSWRGGLAAPIREHLGLVASWWMVYALVAACVWGVAAWVLSLGRRPERAVRGLAVFAAIVCVAMLMAALTHGKAVGACTAIGWALIGLASVGLGGWARAVRLEAIGLWALGLATVRLVAFDAIEAPAGIAWAGLELSVWTLAAGLIGACWLAAGAIAGGRAEGSPRGRALRDAGAWAMVAMLMVAPLVGDWQATSLLWVWVVVSVGAAAGSVLVPRLRLEPPAAAALGLCALAWCGVYLAEPALDWTGGPTLAGLHQGLWSGLIAGGTMAAMCAWRLGDVPRWVRGRLVMVGWGVALFLAWSSTSLEVARLGALATGDQTVRKAAISIWWGLFAAGLIGSGFWRSAALVRQAGLALMFVAGVTVVVVDLAGVPPAWRVASFLLLGLMMLAVAFGYAKVTSKRPTAGEAAPDA
ncbi:MAG: DUF2339 domain-containing protein [Phycisphaerae bacterium]|nr:DUF2339 domain-containing protein [Phycisphaerae bacterium]